MSFTMEAKEFVPEGGDPNTVPTSKNPNKRFSGKGSKARKTDAFRMSVGRKQLEEYRNAAKKRLFIFDQSTEQLNQHLANVKTVIQPTAKPLTVATRGIGFAVTAEYDRMCTTWTFESISEICTIYQYFRVALYLAEYKLSLASQIQCEMPSEDVSEPVELSENLRQILAPVTQVPRPTYNILTSIGKIEGSCVWHSVKSNRPRVTGGQMALYLYPNNIRGTLVNLSNPAYNATIRDQFHALNPLPGANWRLERGHWLLQNPEEIWPNDYGTVQLQRDIKDYRSLLSRVSKRLPPTFIMSISWDGCAKRSGLVSMNPVPMYIKSNFTARPATKTSRRRTARGTAVEHVADGDMEYSRDDIEGSDVLVPVWVPDIKIERYEFIAGAGTMVGEQIGDLTRRQISRRKHTRIVPYNVISVLVDAPRQVT